ncbi:nuclear transport factor 2 family protein [Geodermatophilus poikilotrophus]|uniref:nuclear transport factor 2 family protein n=1 Tax=Geodermatophilus poikilotrophus TaxID=1333667 RepID=UPI000B82C508|nr:nuclear transport factor 2 family protein [Geodermatophilus poikilotrophus]
MSDDRSVVRDLVLRWAAAEPAEHPGHRLRITLGLRRDGGRWRVAHEHHSFPLR